MALSMEVTREFQVVPFPSIPGYEIVEEMGRGGMGVVYKARQEKLGRWVALKVLLPELAEAPEKLARFQIEANAVARLQHPNIVQIFEVGRSDGRPFIALELVESGTLAEKLGTPWPAASAAHFVEQLARAIHYAHERGIVHRDLKPANILLANNGMGTGQNRNAFTRHTTHHSPFTTYQPKIADFGLAKLLDDELTTSTNGWQTRIGVVLGSPPYMAPEQAAGRIQDIGPATDIHALGMILYEMLTCQPPFRGASLLETLELVKTQVPLPPSKLLPGVDGELDAICLKCLEKNPKRRYPTAEALAEALARFQKSLEKRSHPASILFVNRPRPLTVVALQVILAVISALGSGVSVWQVLRADKETRRASAKLQKGNEKIWSQADSPASHDDRKQQMSAEASILAFGRGLALCDRGDIGLGMLWFARGLREAPVEDQQLQRLIRANLAHWQSKLNPLQFSFPHPGQVENVGIGADGKIAFTLCHIRSSATDQHSEVRFWTLTTGQQISEPIVRKELITTTALCPDGSALILAGPGRTAGLVDVPTGQAIGSPLQHKAEITCVAFSNNSQMVLTGSADHTAQVWNAKNGQPIGLPLQHQSAVTSVAFSPDGCIAATASADGNVQLWNTATGQPKSFQMKHDAAVRALAFNSNGHMLLTSGDDRSARVWDATTGRPIGQPRLHSDRILAVAFSPDGLRFATASSDRTARIWETVNGTQPVTLSHQSAVKSVQFSPDGQKLLTVCFDFTAQLWDSKTGKRLGSALACPEKVVTAIFSPDGSRILTGSQDGAKLWQIGGGSQASPPLQHRARISAISFSPDGQSVLTASWDGTAHIWNAKTGEPIGLPLEHNGPVQSAAFSPDGGTIVTGGGALDKTARLWDARTGRALCAPLVHPSGLTAVGFTADGMTVVTTGADHMMRYWSVSNPALGPSKVLANEKSKESGNDSPMARSSDGSMILIGDRGGSARLWDVATSKPIGPPLQHSSSISALAFSPDGRMMATGDSEGSVQLWKVPEPMTGDADQIVSWVEKITGMKIDSIRGSNSEELIAVHSQDN